jgi:hypothetical protein
VGAVSGGKSPADEAATTTIVTITLPSGEVLQFPVDGPPNGHRHDG